LIKASGGELGKHGFENCEPCKQRQNFAERQAEAESTVVFSNLVPVLIRGGENEIKLCRASAMRWKGHYSNNAVFMTNLRGRVQVLF
jgi:hypothetical protein